VLDRTAQTEPFDEVLLDDVSAFTIEALSETWLEIWPPEGSSAVSGTGPAQPLTVMPRAIRFTLTLNDAESVQRIIPAVGG
jgi:hypothetical protein